MKKLKTIICSIICLLLICNIFAGCKNNNDDPPQPETEVVITLNDAKTIINNCLGNIDEDSVTLNSNKLLNNSINQNRNLFVKLVNS